MDNLTNDAVVGLAIEVEKILAAKGLRRLKQAALDTPLDIGVTIPTVLTDDYVSFYDGLFYWEE